MDTETRSLWTIVSAPPGPAGTARERYAAAMEFWRRGELPPEVLEIYRICVIREDEDPLALLAAWGRGRAWAARVRAFRDDRLA